MSDEKPVYFPLVKAARKARMSPRRLLWLCESNSVDAHGACYGGIYIVWGETVERFRKRRARIVPSGGTGL